MKRSHVTFTVSVVLLVALFVSIPGAFAQTRDSSETEKAGNADALVYRDPSGVSVEYSNDGSDWVRIRSIGESDLLFGDNRDVQDAVRKATLKAKAEISKFISEKIKAKEVAEEMSMTMTEHNGEDQTANRKTVDTLTSKIANSSESILKGVITIEQKTDKAAKRVSVTVGVSRKTIGVADSLSGAIKSDQEAPAGGNAGSPAATPGSETRRSKNYDDF